jgi:acetyl-CoA acyltransferase
VAEPVDGAAAVVLATREAARAAGRRGVVRIAGIGLATDDPAAEHQAAPLTAGATHAAGAAALRMAGLAPADVELVEVHDVCTSAELLAIEALGLVPPGTAGPATADGVTSPDGRCPVNASGGLLGAGHAGAAAGLAQVVALVEQLRGTAGPLQVRGVRRALAQSGGGCGATSVVTVLIGED